MTGASSPKLLSRRDARTAGLARFFTGKPCRRGHVVERTVARGDCVECAAARKKRWYGDNWAQADAASKDYVARNKERAQATVRAWVVRNRARMVAIAVRYHAANLRRMPAWADHEAIEA
ncbi:MAG: hypothetical protein ACRETS_04945, partial [Steroidobacteraceae bacterium]